MLTKSEPDSLRTSTIWIRTLININKFAPWRFYFWTLQTSLYSKIRKRVLPHEKGLDLYGLTLYCPSLVLNGEPCLASPLSLYSLIGDSGKSQNICKWFNIWSNFFLWWHVFVPNWLVPPTQISLLSHIEYTYLCFCCSSFENHILK